MRAKVNSKNPTVKSILDMFNDVIAENRGRERVRLIRQSISITDDVSSESRKPDNYLCTLDRSSSMYNILSVSI